MIKEHNFQTLIQALNKSLWKFIYRGKSKLIGSSVACIVISDEVNSAEYWICKSFQLLLLENLLFEIMKVKQQQCIFYHYWIAAMQAYLEEYHRSTAFHCKVTRVPLCYTQNISIYEKHLITHLRMGCPEMQYSRWTKGSKHVFVKVNNTQASGLFLFAG